MNQVERWFAELTRQLLERGDHRSVYALERDIRAWVTAWNENPKPFVWTSRICAQPFPVAMRSNGIEHKHIPHFLLITDQEPTVVDVKPARRLSKPEVVSTFTWTRAALERRGWLYEAWSEPNEVELQNVRFLAVYGALPCSIRRCWRHFVVSILTELRSVTSLPRFGFACFTDSLGFVSSAVVARVRG